MNAHPYSTEPDRAGQNSQTPGDQHTGQELGTRPQSRADVALIYLRAWGWASVPANGKRPIIKWGLPSIPDRPSEDLLVRWWRSSPQANLAIVTGWRSLLVVGDADPRHGGSLQMFHDLGWPRDTPTVDTGSGGNHIYALYPDDGKPVRGVPNYGPGLEVKADGNIVIAPPSLHPTTMQSYRWHLGLAPWEVALKPLPPEVLAALRSRRSPQKASGAVEPLDDDALADWRDVGLADYQIARRARARYCQALKGVAEGEHRNNTLYLLAAHLYQLGFPRSVVKRWCRAFSDEVYHDNAI